MKLKVFKIKHNSEWDRGLFEAPRKVSSYPRNGIIAETQEEFLNFLRKKMGYTESNDYLKNPSLYDIQSRDYNGKKKKGNQVAF